MAAYVAYGRAQRHLPCGLFALAGVALFGLAACSKLGLGGQDEMSWARAALERNDRLEVVAADPQTSTFTVRVKATGELSMVRADQVVGSPPVLAAPVALSAAAPPAASTNTTAAPESSSQAISEGPGAPAAREDSANAPRTGLQPQSAPVAQAPNPGSDVASITPGGRLLESGPGYAIKAASKGAPTIAQREQSSKTSAALEHRLDPIICQGDRLLQIDNRNLEFDGDAVLAEDGCEIHITNSHISAKGVGVSARAANVHIDNSQIEGEGASIDASGGSQVYFSSSTFRGSSRRLGNSSFHDLGGNVWN
jgi:hypothetical protein